MSSEAPGAAKKNANSYYYWHGHEKERAKVGDVAPMPTPQLVSRDDSRSGTAVAGSAQVAPAPSSLIVKKYSWCNEAKVVSVYVDTVEADRELLVEESVQVHFTRSTADVTFTTTTAEGVQRQKKLLLPLSKRINDATSSFKIKPKTQQLLLKLVKSKEETWHELIGKATSDDSNEGSDDD